jgi:hypothetical protein
VVVRDDDPGKKKSAEEEWKANIVTFVVVC